MTTPLPSKLPPRKVSIRFPRLDTILMVENFLRKNSGKHTRKEIWEKLPKRMMYQTFQIILAYLNHSKKISMDNEGKIFWIHDAPVQKLVAPSMKLEMAQAKPSTIMMAQLENVKDLDKTWQSKFIQ